MQMLHCLKQCEGEGGTNVFTDGAHVARQLRDENPEHFETLTRIHVDYVDAGREFYEFHKVTNAPVFRYV